MAKIVETWKRGRQKLLSRNEIDFIFKSRDVLFITLNSLFQLLKFDQKSLDFLPDSGVIGSVIIIGQMKAI
jgi:hypothetical protein